MSSYIDFDFVVIELTCFPSGVLYTLSLTSRSLVQDFNDLACFVFFCGSLRVNKIGLGLGGQYYGMSQIFHSMRAGFMKFLGLLKTNRPLHPDKNTGTRGDQPEGLPMIYGGFTVLVLSWLGS